MERTRKIHENAKKKSVSRYIVFTHKGQKYRLDKKVLKNNLKKAAITVILIASLVKVAPTVYDKISHAIDVKNIALEESSDANSLLAKYDLHVVPSRDGEWNNQYYKIEELSEKDLYGFCHYCGYEEAENVLRALGYSSWNNFLSMNGYYDESGNPSIHVWENYEEVRLISEKKEEQKLGRNR